MCIPIPHLIGSVEVEERRPRTWDEPRRKRLNFVNDHNRRIDEWALTPRYQARQFPHNEQEYWDLRQLGLQQRFHQRQMQFDHQRWMLDQQRMQQLYGPPVPPGWHGHQGRQQQLQQQQQHPLDLPTHPVENRAHHGNSDEIVAIENGSDDSDDDHRRGSGRKPPKLLEASHRARLPRQLKLKGRRKKGGRRVEEKHRGRVIDSSSDSSEDSFQEALRRRTSKSRGHSRSRSRVKFVGDDSSSDDSFVGFGLRLGKNGRGRW